MVKKIFSDIDSLLERRLGDQLRIGKLEGEQWFRNPLGWLLVCFNNPLNFKNPNGELIVLQNNRKHISPYIKGLKQVHYGVGVGETELELIRFELEQSETVDLEAIDINKTFIELFGENLKDKEFEFGQNAIQAKLFQELFQNHPVSFKENVLHICLGGTLGNFDDASKELWQIFQKNSKIGDLLILGVKTDEYLDTDLKKYETNLYYPPFVLTHVKKLNTALIQWIKDDNGYIRMKYDKTEVFRTRRFNKEDLIEEAKSHAFDYVDSWICEYGHSLVVIFKKAHQ